MVEVAKMDTPGSGDAALYDRQYFLAGRDFFARHQGTRLSDRLAPAFLAGDVTESDLVLDLGFGRGEILFHSALRGALVTGFDFSDAAHVIAASVLAQLPNQVRARVSLNRGDITEHSVSLTPASVVFMVDVLEHLPVDAGCSLLERIGNCVAPDGRIVIATMVGQRTVDRSAPNLAATENKYLASTGHHAIYSEDTIRTALPPQFEVSAQSSSLLLAHRNNSATPWLAGGPA